MRPDLPSYLGGHVTALTGVLALHAGIAAWALQPEPPVAIPQQQVIQVSMVAPSVLKQEAATPPAPEVKETPPTPPAKKGMVKAEEKQKPRPQEKAEKAKSPAEIPQQQTQTRLTSGLQSPEAMAQASAITKPVPADYLENPPPSYPQRARRLKQQGTVLLDVRVTTGGMPASIRIQQSSGYESLDDAALQAVRQWRFIPARRGTELVEANVIIPVRFHIN